MFDLVHDALNLVGISAAEREELLVFSMYLVQRPVATRLLGFISVQYTFLIKVNSRQERFFFFLVFFSYGSF